MKSSNGHEEIFKRELTFIFRESAKNYNGPVTSDRKILKDQLCKEIQELNSDSFSILTEIEQSKNKLVELQNLSKLGDFSTAVEKEFDEQSRVSREEMQHIQKRIKSKNRQEKIDKFNRDPKRIKEKNERQRAWTGENENEFRPKKNVKSAFDDIHSKNKDEFQRNTKQNNGQSNSQFDFDDNDKEPLLDEEKRQHNLDDKRNFNTFAPSSSLLHRGGGLISGLNEQGIERGNKDDRMKEWNSGAKKGGRSNINNSRIDDFDFNESWDDGGDILGIREDELTQLSIKNQNTEKTKSLAKLQRGLAEIMQMFRDMSSMLSQQREDLKLADVNLDNALDNMDVSLSQLERARRRFRRHRGLIIKIFAVLALFLIIVGIFVR
ncbi:MAG: hypothetical protein EZS28_025724 [Streblomastix strix]|uniref:t-SNARE coiled-coil homology domain-containing protein n=1 Tax=Streblomastix strix TaxID=222440 RepID=A0A5J4V8D0_9EUKA|nr:MAG: hypothetical protein EZS28_025724 [Streblomastix strix]